MFFQKNLFKYLAAAAAGYEIGKAEKKPEGKMYGGSAKNIKKAECL
jgi:hypothetical protein